MTPREAVAALLAPMELAEFFGHWYGARPCVIRGGGRRVSDLMSLETIVNAIAGDAEPTGKLLVDVDRIRPDARPGAELARAFEDRILEGTEPLWAYLEEGHSVVWNGARGARVELDRICADLAQTLGASVWPNVYATGTAGTPFELHFDCHEVIAVQIEGEKEWTISNVRVDQPLDIPAMRPAIDQALRDRRAEAQADLAILTTVEPGDVVYVPRGQFHNARAIGGRSLHVTFGIQHLTGLDLLEAVLAEAVDDAAFRAYLPAAMQDPTGARRGAHVADLARRASALATSPRVAALLERLEVHLRSRPAPEG